MSVHFLDFEGRRILIEPGDTVASALFRAGVRTFSRSFKYHRRRGLYCLTCDCPNCLVTVDGEPAVPACTTEARPGQKVVRENAWPSPEFDLLALLGRLHPLLRVGFYYKTMLRPRWLWPKAEPVIRRVAGLGGVPLNEPPVNREARHLQPDVLVIGGGVAGLAAALAAEEAGRSVLLCDEGMLGEKVAPGATRERIKALAGRACAAENVTILERAPAIGIYEGPLVPVNAPDFLHLVHPKLVVVATGAVERHAVFPGSDLPGVWLGRGAARLAGVHGVAPGRRAVVVGPSAEAGEHADVLRGAGVEVRLLERGEVLEARGRKVVRSVVVRSGAGRERIACDALVLSLGFMRRDGLLRQGAGLAVVGAGEVVDPGCALEQAEASGRRAALGEGSSAREPGLPVRARGGFVCLCEDVEVRDLEDAWREGFCSTELLKRYTTATMGPCQGALCHAHLRAFVASRAGAEAQVAVATTARPPTRGIKLEDVAAGERAEVEQRTALDERHLELGATMEPAGEWRRPERYGDPLAEYWAVRRDVSVMDVGTLGKYLVSGQDATEFLDRLYPCYVRDIAEGRIRYALLLGANGFVFDDGLICSLSGGRWYLTFTSGGADYAEAFLRDWIETWGLEVHLINQTAAVGAINVAGPRARELVQRLSPDPLDNARFPYLNHREIEVAGVPCRAIRLGFVGEQSYELHHPSSRSVELWDALLEAGADLSIRPHGLEALRLLRLEKGHVIVGQDTDYDSTPAKLGMEWVAKLDKPTFVGKVALERIGALPMERKLIAVRFEDGTPAEGAPLTVDGRQVGHLTSSRFSPVLGHAVALGWTVRMNGEFPARVRAGEATGTVVSGPFYDPEGARLRA